MRRALVALLMSAGGVAPVQAQDAAASPRRADYAWPLLTLDNRRASLEALRGRVVVVNSWATWCEPCVAELASLQALRAAVPDTLLAFALVAPQRAEPVRAFVRRRGLTLPVYLEAAPPPRSFGFEAVPTSWIIDRRGTVVAQHRGAIDWNTPRMQAELRALLREVPRDSAGH